MEKDVGGLVDDIISYRAMKSKWKGPEKYHYCYQVKKERKAKKKEKGQYLTSCLFFPLLFFSSFSFSFFFLFCCFEYMTGYISDHSIFFKIGLHQDGYTENSRYVIDPFFPFSPI